MTTLPAKSVSQSVGCSVLSPCCCSDVCLAVPGPMDEDTFLLRRNSKWSRISAIGSMNTKLGPWQNTTRFAARLLQAGRTTRRSAKQLRGAPPNRFQAWPAIESLHETCRKHHQPKKTSIHSLPLRSSIEQHLGLPSPLWGTKVTATDVHGVPVKCIFTFERVGGEEAWKFAAHWSEANTRSTIHIHHLMRQSKPHFASQSRDQP